MIRQRNRTCCRAARATLIWAVVGFVAFQIAVVVAADAFAAEVYDSEYAARFVRIKARHAEHPERPLLVMLGSSRVCQLFRPEQMPPLITPDGRTVLPFNFARIGGGPVYSRLAYSRLCQEGLAPEWVVVEIMPALMVHRHEHFFYPSVTANELNEMRRYISSRRLFDSYAKNRILPGYKNRTGLLRVLAPSWALPGQEDPDQVIDALGGEGQRIRSVQSDADRQAKETRVSAGYAEILANFRVDPGSDRALRDLIRECRADGVRVAFVRTPESSTYRTIAYQPETLATLDAYLENLRREFGVAVIDSREWLPDREIDDGHHPLLSGQKTFTSRLHSEVLVPLVNDQLRATNERIDTAKR
ncbi:MAG: hypothetical protein C0467_18125 [Planctomycetaceae bacterium]|nr:hypothetical protein [Planctomycetaceae bacterium]